MKLSHQLCLACLILFPFSSSAEENAPPPTSVIADEELLEMSLEQLMTVPVFKVTARKRLENAQSVPMSVSVMEGEYLDAIRAGAPDIGFLAWRSPSLGYESSFGRLFPRFYIRGLGNTDFDINASQPVSLVYDDVVYENPILKGLPVFDTKQIEILRGPQGSLFGKNTPAGVVKFESVKPSHKSDSSARVAYGTHDTVDGEFAVGGELSETTAIRFSMLHQQRGDFVDNLAPGDERTDALGGFEDTAGRLQLLVEPNERFSALFRYHFRNLDDNLVFFRANSIQKGTNRPSDDFHHDQIFQDAAESAFERATIHGGGVTLDYNAPEYSITSVTGIASARALARGDIDGGYGAAFLPSGSGPGEIPFPSETSDGLDDHTQFSQELRLASHNTAPLGYQLGLFYFYEDIGIESYSFDSIQDHALNGVAYQTQKTQTTAAFGTLSYSPTSRWEVSVGTRFSHDSKDFEAMRTLGPFDLGPLETIRVDPSDSHLSWDVSSLYRLSEEHSLYARVANGFRAPSVQGRVLFGNDVTVADSEELYSFEVGSKSTLFGGKGFVNASLFYYLMHDQQLTAVGGESNFNRLLNADKTVGYGAELESRFRMGSELELLANTSFNFTEIDDNTLSVQSCAQCTITDPIGPEGRVLIDGNSLPYAPQWIGNIAAKWSRPLATGRVSVLTDWSYRSETNFFLYDSREFSGKALVEGGLRAAYGWGAEDQAYEIAAFSRNITDENPILGAVDFNNLTGIFGSERFLGIEFKARL